jgi:hypothetical protein
VSDSKKRDETLNKKGIPSQKGPMPKIPKIPDASEKSAMAKGPESGTNR